MIRLFAEEELIQIRRKLHQIPEIGMEEYQTAKYLLEIISTLPQQYLEIKTWKTAILVHVLGKDGSKTIGYRCDIDGLPILEKTGLDYASKHPNMMHACGHDIHMTVALGILSYFAKNQPKCNMLFLFQPSEEILSGGRQVYESGILDEWFPDEIYGLHDNPQLKAGVIGCRMGTLFAGTCEIHAKFIGKSGHAAFPHLANDMVVAGSQFVVQLQTIISRNLNPIEAGVVTLGKFLAGTIGNVIAGSCEIDGTIRALTQKNNLLIQKKVRQIAEGIAESFDCKVQLNLEQGGYYPVENNDKTTAYFINYMKKNADFVETKPAMTGEDFGFLLSKIPGTMFWLGVESPYSLHSEYLAPREDAIFKGVKAIIGFLKERQKVVFSASY